jgi:hypothetical protein
MKFSYNYLFYIIFIVALGYIVAFTEVLAIILFYLFSPIPGIDSTGLIFPFIVVLGFTEICL